jgi:hypothetical protein
MASDQNPGTDGNGLDLTRCIVCGVEIQGPSALCEWCYAQVGPPDEGQWDDDDDDDDDDDAYGYDPHTLII